MYPFKEGSFAPRNGWYVAAFAEQIGEELVSRVILNEPVVLYRKADGTAVAVGGRCPHRHFPLGESCRVGDEIACGYHGIRFGPDGQCTHIPSQKVVPASYRIPTYPLVEHGMWLWIWMGDREKADPALLPPLEEIWFGLDGRIGTPVFHAEVKARYQLMNDNLLDLTHLSFLHAKALGTTDDAETPETHVKRDRFISSRRTMTGVPLPSMFRETETNRIIPDAVDRESGMDFYLPGFHAGVSDLNYPADHPVHPGEPFDVARVYHAVTPSTETTCYYWFGFGYAENAPYRDFMFEKAQQIVAEDVFASEEIEKMLQIIKHSPQELMIRTDKGAVEARRMLQAIMDEEAKEVQLA